MGKKPDNFKSIFKLIQIMFYISLESWHTIPSILCPSKYDNLIPIYLFGVL